jgi:hypothetical protein
MPGIRGTCKRSSCSEVRNVQANSVFGDPSAGSPRPWPWPTPRQECTGSQQHPSGQSAEMADHVTAELKMVERLARSLTKARTIHEVKYVRDKAEASWRFTKLARFDLSVQNHAAELMLRAERWAEELLAQLLRLIALAARGRHSRSRIRAVCRPGETARGAHHVGRSFAAAWEAERPTERA